MGCWVGDCEMGGERVGLLDVKFGEVKKDGWWWVRSCGDIFRSAVYG